MDIADGEFLTLLGPSGCGKSTLLRILAGLEFQDHGSVAIDGRSVDGVAPKRRDMAMVFQSYALYPHMTAAENMALPLTMRRLNAWERLPVLRRLLPSARRGSADIQAEIDRTARALGIEQLLARKPGQLSGGQRQRVALGRAMVRQPAVFLMDEPLSNLDAKLRTQMRREIKDLHLRLGTTFIYVTHDQTEAMTLSDRVALMLDGDVLQVASPQEIYANPQDLRVAEFVGSPKINLIRGAACVDGALQLAGAVIQAERPVQNGEVVTLGIRPEALHLAQGPGPGVLAGPIRMIEHVGSDVFAHVHLAGPDCIVTARLAAGQAPHLLRGQILHLDARPDKVLVFTRDGRRACPAAAQAAMRSKVAG